MSKNVSCAIVLFSSLCLFLTVSCMSRVQKGTETSISEIDQKRIEEIHNIELSHEESIALMNEKLKKTKENLAFNTKEILTLKTTLISMKESIGSLKQELQAFQRKQNSGLSSLEASSVNKTANQNDNATMLPNFIPGQSGFLEDRSDSQKNTQPPSSPEDILAKAEVEIESSKFNLALESLNNFENRFPNFKKKDKYYFLLAKANFYLKNYDTSLENLKVLFLDYPKSDVILEGKFLEAKAFEKTQATQKAIDIYKDIIQSAPNKHAVQNARLAIKRLQAMQK